VDGDEFFWVGTLWQGVDEDMDEDDYDVDELI